MAVLGLDVGTGGTRAVVVDELGSILASSSAEHLAFASPQPGWAEQNPQDWWQATVQAVRQAMQACKLPPSDIRCVGFSGQMHGAVLLDDKDEVIRSALIWCDQRTEAQCKNLVELFGLEHLIQLTCNPPLSNFTLTKLLWVKEHEPENWERVRHILLPKDYVRFRLTGERASDVADASGMLLLDVARRRWSDEVLSKTEIERELLPQLFESQEVCGSISESAARVTGLRAGTPVVAGAGDQAAGAVGMGICRPGVVSATIGTSGVVFAATDRPALDPRGRLHTFCHAIPGRWHVMGVTQAAGLSLRWLREVLRNPQKDNLTSYDYLTEAAEKVGAATEGVFWAPYLMGERTPHLDPNARAAFVGLCASHGQAHLIRAVLECVAFSLKETFAIFNEIQVPVQQIRLGGGGARSSLWRQIQADVYGKEVEILEADEGAAFGAAMLAGVGGKIWDSVDQACDAVVRVNSRVRPNPQNSLAMQKGYDIYRRIYPALRTIFDLSKTE
jgi:xylulokinase